MAHLPVASNMLQKRWDQRAYQMHVKKRKAMTSGLNTKQSKSFLHIKVNLKRLQNEEEKQASIDYENRILLAKLSNVLRSNGQLDNWNYDHELHSQSLNQRNLENEKDKIQEDNQRLLRKIKKSTSWYNTDKCEDDFLMHNYYLDLKDSTTKTTVLGGRAVEKEPFIFHSADRPQHDQEGNERLNCETIGEDDIPDMNDLKITSCAKKIRKGPPRLPVLGMERKKLMKKKKKEAARKVLHYDAKAEAVKLFKSTKGMGKTESVVIDTLCKRTQTQRQLTKAKFEEQFGLKLEEELSPQLDDDYCVLVKALLTSEHDYDAECLQKALKGHGPFVETFIEVLSTQNNKAVYAIKESYFARYGMMLEADIKAEVRGQLRHLLHALIKGERTDSSIIDTEAAKKDALRLKSSPESTRWHINAGPMSDMMVTASWDHVDSVLQEYEVMTGGSVIKEFEKSLLADYKDAMISLVRCLRDCPVFLAEQLHKNLQPNGDEMTVLRIILMRSEIDMPMIRKAYKKLYKETLMDSMRKNLPLTCSKALVQMVVLHGTPKNNPPATREEEVET